MNVAAVPHSLKSSLVPSLAVAALLAFGGALGCGGTKTPTDAQVPPVTGDSGSATDASTRRDATVINPDAIVPVEMDSGETPDAEEPPDAGEVPDAEEPSGDAGSCNPGERRVNGVCEACDQVGACGSDCTACPAADPNGSYACRGNSDPAADACVLTCNDGFRNDNGTCVECNTTAQCGTDCTACPNAPANGAYTCNGNAQPSNTACNLTCNAGFRNDSGLCVPCNNNGACGSDCQACPQDPANGTYSCAGNSAPSATSCTLACGQGFQLQSGQCVACNLTNACGNDCAACPPNPANGQFACSGNVQSSQQACSLGCNNGFRAQNGQCNACNVAAACGIDCAACPANPQGGTYACSGNTTPAASACNLSCSAGFRPLNGQCVACNVASSCGIDCGTCPANPANGSYVCGGNTNPAAQSCNLTCNPGFRNVNGQCVACSSTNTCGNDCAACPANPANGNYTCSGNTQPAQQSCTLACTVGFRPVNGQCAACNSTTTCGNDCAACSANPANGTFTCSGNTQPAAQACTLGCAAGFRAVNGQCVACSATATCGSDCAACPAAPANGQYTCGGNTQPAAQACTLGCAAGFRLVNGQCVACNATTACGNDCQACPANPAGGTYTCGGNTQPAAQACTLACGAGFRAQGGQCTQCNAVGACGSDCAACPANPAGGTYSCLGNQNPSSQSCALACGVGFRLQGGQCVACNTTGACGTDCGACPANPANGAFVCGNNTQPSANACQLACAAGFRAVNGQCAACNAVGSCGSDCAACPANPANGTFTCGNNTQPAAQACTLGCGPGFRAVNGQCVACNGVGTCGTDCAACPANPPGGTYVCANNTQTAANACTLTCGPGVIRVGDQCVACNTLANCGNDCAACPANPANGTFACANNTQPAANACNLTCAAGFRAVNGQCVACTAVAACGTDCAACPANPANGTYACGGNTQTAAQSCLLSCAAGFRVQGNQCVACSTTATCGSDCGACPANPPNGTFACAGNTDPAGTSCTLTCAAGFRRQGNTCVPCNDAATCGSDCAACPQPPDNAAYTCAGNTMPAANSCNLACAAGFQLVMGMCVPCNTLASCGTNCAACPADPNNGAYTCANNTQPSAQACVLGCGAGFTPNNGQCAQCGTPQFCGSDCQPCPANPQNGTWACTGTVNPAAQSCVLNCAAGLRAVNGQCVPCNVAEQCGSDCGACPNNPANGNWGCTGNGAPAATACNLTCNAGFTRNGTDCDPCTTTAACGTDCAACPAAPANGTVTCANNTTPGAQACVSACNPGFRNVNGACVACNTTAACGSNCAACPATGGPFTCTGNTLPAANSCALACPAGQRRVNGACTNCGNMAACLDGCGTCTPNPACAGEADPPLRLECTYFYSDFATRTISNDVYPFDPGFHLWSDGAEKARYIYLPPGRQIDTSNMDEWTFPVGTRVFKEFRVPDDVNTMAPPVLVETRLLIKLPNGLWNRSVYVWTSTSALRYDGAVGLVTPANVRGPSGVGTPTEDPGAISMPGSLLAGMTTTYEIPPSDVCGRCHQGRIDNLLGFEAVSLSTPEAGNCTNARPGNPCLTMAEAIRNGLLTQPPATPITVPGTAAERAALGFLHANCGTCCHNPSPFSQASFTGFFMRLETGQLALNNVRMLNTFTTGVRVVSGWQPDGSTGRFRITPGAADQSIVIYRMNARNTRRASDGDLEQMPPLATHRPSPDGLATVRAWMNAITP